MTSEIQIICQILKLVFWQVFYTGMTPITSGSQNTIQILNRSRFQISTDFLKFQLKMRSLHLFSFFVVLSLIRRC